MSELFFFFFRLNTRPVFGGVRSRIGIQQNLLSRSSPAVNFQRTFDARQKIGITDARHKLGVKDAREKLVQKDTRFKIKGKVQDAREMLNSRKQQSVAAEKVTKVVDAREKISLKRNTPAAISPAMGTVNPAVKITKTIQVGQASHLRAPRLFCSSPVAELHEYVPLFTTV